MLFEDPAEIDCEACHQRSLLPVKQLLRLQAICPHCGHSLATVGLQMRALLDDWHAFMLLVELVLEIEQATGTTVSDPELDCVHSLRQLADVLEGKLPNTEHRHSLAIGIVERAARTIAQREVVNLDATIVDALKPDRWA